MADEAMMEAGFATIPIPNGVTPGTVLRLVHHGVILAQRAIEPGQSLREALTPQATAHGDGLELKWGHTGQPALVRYSADNGLTWTTIGIDITDGELKLPMSSIPRGAGEKLKFEVRLGL